MILSNLNKLITRSILVRSHPSLQSIICRNASTDETEDKPVKFSTSKAKSWDSINTFSNQRNRQQPKLQPLIVIGSLMIFLIYFGLLREENELDAMISRPLEESVPNIKEFTLRKQISQYDNMGLDANELKQALAEELKKKATDSSGGAWGDKNLNTKL